ncbi:MAG: ABC transporter, substrate-binding protein [Burkholderiaceae bacterium]|jgi:NitT/TauT family transport system substrate-binding protein|nr:MAG: ABC transporter, substrate-binding protein [Burkholderiaceae bacterium]
MTTAGTAAVLAAVPFVRNARAQGLQKVVYQAGWLPQPDKGGLYQALATGIYKAHGLDVDLRPGGAQMNVNALFLAGRADFADSDSLRVLNFVRQGLPGVAVAAYGQKHPVALASHPNMGLDTLAELKGKPVMVSAIGRQTYWPWLKSKFGYTDDQIRPDTGSLAPFLNNKAMSMECFVTSEPYDMKRAGVDASIKLLADSGYASYYGITLAHPKMIAEQPDVVQRFVDASIKGWASYLGGDPSPGNALIKKGNPDMTDQKIAYCISAMKRYGIVQSGDTAKLGLGAMTDAHWRDFYDAMATAEVLPRGLDIQKGYTLQFVNKHVEAS